MTPGDRLLTLSLRERGLLPPVPPRPTAAHRGASYAEATRLTVEALVGTSPAAQRSCKAVANLLALLEAASGDLADTPELLRAFRDACDGLEALAEAAVDEHDAPSPLQPGDWAGPRHANGDLPPEDA